MSFPRESCATRYSCHQFHRSILPKNFRIKIHTTLDEDTLHHPLEDVILDNFFIVHSHNTRRAIQTIIGEDLFPTFARNVLFPSTLVSIFFSNAMDLLQSPSRLEIIAIKVIRPKYWADNKLKCAMQNYDLWSGNALVGGIFTRTMLMKNH